MRQIITFFSIIFFSYEYVLITSSNNKPECLKQLNDLFKLSDDEFISTLNRWSKTINSNKLQELITPFAFGGRKYLYKPAYIFFDSNSKETPTTNNFFRSLFSCSYRELVIKSKKLAKLLKRHIKEIEPLDIILERTPVHDGEQYQLDGFEIYNTRKKRFDPHPVEIDSLNNYLKNNRQAYIYCNPKYYDRIKELSIGDNNILQTLISEI